MAKESRYLRRELDGTRTAYGVGGARTATYPGGPAGSPATARQLDAEVAAAGDLRLMDPSVVSRTFQQGVVSASAGSAQADGPGAGAPRWSSTIRPEPLPASGRRRITAAGGVPVGTAASRLLYAIKFGDVYGGQDFWDVPGDPSGAAPGTGAQPPAYLR